MKTFTKEKRHKIDKKYGGRCAYCGSTENLTIDHITPISKGGTNRISNLNPCCYACNQSKGELTIEEFREEIFIRIQPDYIPRISHRIRRAIARHPDETFKIAQPRFWAETLTKFTSPVVFFCEKQDSSSLVDESPFSDKELVNFLFRMFNDTKPKYSSMAGFGFYS